MRALLLIRRVLVEVMWTSLCRFPEPGEDLVPAGCSGLVALEDLVYLLWTDESGERWEGKWELGLGGGGCCGCGLVRHV